MLDYHLHLWPHSEHETPLRLDQLAAYCERAQAAGRLAQGDPRGAAAEVKSLADTLAVEAESLNAEVHRFLSDVQAA